MAACGHTPRTTAQKDVNFGETSSLLVCLSARQGTSHHSRERAAQTGPPGVGSHPNARKSPQPPQAAGGDTGQGHSPVAGLSPATPVRNDITTAHTRNVLAISQSVAC